MHVLNCLINKALSKMNQCVPSWGLEDNPNPPKLPFQAHSNSISSASHVPTLDYEVAELTWENGQLSMHGLCPPRVPNKPQSTPSTAKYTWEKPRAGGTLEAIVNQATLLPAYKTTDVGSCGGDEVVPWFDQHLAAAAAVPVSASACVSATMTMDALVPCANTRDDEPSMQVMVSGNGTCVVGCSTRVGSCAEDNKFERQRVSRVGARAAHEWSCRDQSVSVSGSATFGRDLSVRGLTSTSTGSQGNTSSGKHGGKSTTGDEHDSVSHSRPQRVADDEENKKKGKGKSSISTKRSRAAAIHNQSERKRRDKINQRMKTLQKMVPNSSKTDKASMLDEVIEYLKQLQAQVHLMSRVSPMMMPLAMQQQLQMSMMNPMGMGMGLGMGMGMGMDLNSLAGRTSIPGMPHVLHPSAFMPLPSWEGTGDRIPTPSSLMPDPMSAFLACQSQPMTMDAYSRMAVMFQQMHQQSQGHCSNKH